MRNFISNFMFMINGPGTIEEKSQKRATLGPSQPVPSRWRATENAVRTP